MVREPETPTSALDVTSPCAEVVPLLEVEGASRSVLVGRLNSAVPFPLPRLNMPLGGGFKVAVTVEVEGPSTTPLSTPLSTTGASLLTVVTTVRERAGS